MSEKEETLEKKIEELTLKLKKCEEERNEYLDGWKRAKADFINYKKDEVKRFEEMIKFSGETLIRELLHILDSFDLGLAVLRESDPAGKGMRLIRTQLEDILEQYGLKHIEVQVGDKFNPAREEAIMEIESDLPAGAIAEEVERGYTLHGKVIRPVRVKVAKNKS